MACLWFLLHLKLNGECVEHFRGLMVRRKWKSWPFLVVELPWKPWLSISLVGENESFSLLFNLWHWENELCLNFWSTRRPFCCPRGGITRPPTQAWDKNQISYVLVDPTRPLVQNCEHLSLNTQPNLNRPYLPTPILFRRAVCCVAN